MSRLTDLAVLLPLVLAALAGCDRTPPAPETPGMSSAAFFDAGRFADVWHVAATIGDPACGPHAETWAVTGAGRYRVTGTVCGPSGSRTFATEAAVTGPGRIERRMPEGTEALWVLWTDADYRIAVIGTPSRHFARILSRTPEVRPDLMQAARDVLRFNGYDPAGLQPH